MAEIFHIHPTHPQTRLIEQAVVILRKGGVIVYPTDSGYALGCQLGDKDAIEKIRRIRQLDRDHNFTLMCRDLSELSTYARFSTTTFRLLKSHTPGAYTFILEATKEVPKRLLHPKRKTIGLRVPDNAIAQTLLASMHEPLMSVTLMLPGEKLPLSEMDEIEKHMRSHADLIIEGGFCGVEPTTVIDFTSGIPVIIRKGKGSVEEL